MMFFNRVAFSAGGVDFYIRGRWIGPHVYWQRDPLFGVIHHYTKCNTVRKYGFIVFGLWVYIKID
jgi:hypothetical protein